MVSISSLLLVQCLRSYHRPLVTQSTYPQKKVGKNPPFIWNISIGPSGSGKTPFTERLLKPVYDLQNGVANCKKDSNNLCKGSVLQIFKHYIVSDITVEALGKVMNETPRGILVHHDELSGFIKSHDQYKAKGNDRQKYIELWGCKPWKRDRVSSGTTYIRNTGCSILGINKKPTARLFKNTHLRIKEGL